MSNDTQKRTIVKTITYKTSILIEGLIITYLITGDVKTTLILTGTKNLATLFVYYFHERIWNKIKWGEATDTKR
jgi:uncharacterized membrane protein